MVIEMAISMTFSVIIALAVMVFILFVLIAIFAVSVPFSIIREGWGDHEHRGDCQNQGAAFPQ
jgi:uncharacterized protein HemY